MRGCAIVTVALACSRLPSEPAIEHDRVDPAWVVGPARAALTRGGEFILPPPEGYGTIAEIPHERARDQATAWLRTLAPLSVTRFAEERGEPVNLSDLKLCPRGYHARRTYEELPSEAPLWIQRTYGPIWLMSFCTASGANVISLAVSAHNTDVHVVGGRLQMPRFGGEEFSSNGIAASLTRLPVSPEAAVRLAYQATGVRIRSVPELHTPRLPLHSCLAHWRLELEQPVRFAIEASGDTVLTTEIWVGSLNRDAQPGIAVGGSPLRPFVATYETIDTLTGTPGPVRRVEGLPREGRREWLRARVVGR